LDEARFWDIIESGGPEVVDDEDRQLAAIRERLNLLAIPLFYATSRRYLADVARVRHGGI